MSDAGTEKASTQARIDAAKARDVRANLIFDELRPRTQLPGLAEGFARAARQWDPAAKRWINPLAPRLSPSKPLGLLLRLDGKWAKVGQDDDRRSEPTPYAQRAALIRQTQADRDYLARAREEAGLPAGPQHARQKADRAELLSQTHQLAQRLESAGIPAYRKDGAGLWVWWVCSETAEQLPQFRRICFLPTVAASVRANKLAALEYFIGNHFCRFWTFTSGQRVTADKLRGRIEWLHAKLNQLNQYLRKTWQVELIFRSTELGTLEFDSAGNKVGDNAEGRIETDDQGRPLYHPHAHCVMHSLRGFIKPDEWSRMFDAIWDHWRDDAGNQLNWDGGRKGKSGVIQKPREVCKYVTKPGDLLKLSAADLAATERALHGLKLVQPLGALKTEIATRNAAGKILVRVPTANGKTEWREKIDWNRFALETDEEKEFAKELAECALFAAETRAAATVTPPKAPTEIDKSQPWTRIFARLDCAVGPRGIKEPRVIVGGSVFHKPTVVSHPLVQKLWAETIHEFHHGLSAQNSLAAMARISVHTGTPTAAEPREEYDPDAWSTAAPVAIAAHFAP